MAMAAAQTMMKTMFSGVMVNAERVALSVFSFMVSLLGCMIFFGADENAAQACFSVTSIIYHATLLLDVSLNQDPQKN